MSGLNAFGKVEFWYTYTAIKEQFSLDTHQFSVLFTDVTYLAESADDLVKLADDFVITWYIC